MKKVIIVHCWDGYPEYCWYPYVKKELEARGFDVQVPGFPQGAPKLDTWLPILKEVADTPDEDTYLIGHSVGCITILRYLESLQENQKIGGAVFVAGFTDNLGMDELANFFTTKIPFRELRKRANRFVVIHSDDDPYVPLKHGDIFKERLGAELIIKHNFKHFSGPVDKEDSCVKLPNVVGSILKMTK